MEPKAKVPEHQLTTINSLVLCNQLERLSSLTLTKSNSRISLVIFATLLTALCFARPLSAATVTWVGGNGLWVDPMNWSPQSVPGAGDTAVINGTDPITIGVSENQSVDTLVLSNPNATLRVRGETFSGHVQFTVANGFENRGIIELDNERSANGVILTVTAGTLTNALSGIIRVPDASTNGHRRLEAELDNRGMLEVGADLFLLKNVANSGTVHIPEGRALTCQVGITWTHKGGAITGEGTLTIPPQSGSVLLLESDFTPGANVLDARGLTVNGPGKLFGPAAGELLMQGWTINTDVIVSGDIRLDSGNTLNGSLSTQPGKTLRIVETLAGAQASLSVANGFENHGIIELASEGGSGNLVSLVLSSGILTNAPGGVIRATASANRSLLEADLVNRGLIEATAGMFIRGDVANSGAVAIPAGRTLDLQLPQTIWTHQGGTITGGGTLQFGAVNGSRLELATDFTPGDFILEARGLTVNGPGKLFGPATGELRMQQWTINADMILSGDMRLESGNTLNGSLSTQPGKTLRIVETLAGAQASLSVANGFENHGIIELASEGGSGNLVSLGLTSGILTNAPGGVIRATTAGSRSVLDADLINLGLIEATAGLLIRGDVANSGAVTIPAGLTLALQLPQTIWTHRGGTITGGGTLQFGALNGSRLELEADFTPGAFTLDGLGLTVNGPGKLLGPSTGEFLIRAWTINADVVVSGGLRVEGDVAVNSALTIHPGQALRLVATESAGDVTLTVANGFENHGRIDLTSEAIRNATLVVTTGALTNAADGVIQMLPGFGGERNIVADLENYGIFRTLQDATLKKTAKKKVTNKGQVIVRAGRFTVTQVTADESFENEGDVNVSAGATFKPSGGELINTIAGTFSGSGEFDFSNVSASLEGTLAPGASPGTLGVTGNLPLKSDAVLELEIGGFTPTTEHDQLAVSGAAGLSGTARVTLINGFFPKKDDAFTVLTYASRTGVFATLDNPLPERIAWEVRYGATSAQLVVLNTAPTLAAITNQTVNEETQFSVTATATDQDLPAQSMTYSLDTAPAGMTINPATGQITWTPTEAQGPGNFPVTVRVTDNGTPALGHTNAFTVTVNEVNVAPQLAQPGPQTVNEESELVLTINATDADLPANVLTFEMLSAPPGATFNAATREFRWRPTEAQGPGSFQVSMRVTDNGTPALSHTNAFPVTVNEVNVAPQLVLPGAQTVNELSELAVTINGADTDLPVGALTYELVSGPPGATFNPATRELRWTPTEEQGPGDFTAIFRVMDNNPGAVNEKNLSATGALSIRVNEVNLPPALVVPANRTIHAGAVFSATATATDPDLPANNFTYAKVVGPEALNVSASGLITWATSAADAGTTNEVVLQVTDNSAPNLSATNSFVVTVRRPLFLSSIRRTGSRVEVNWEAIPGTEYKLHYKTNLVVGEWSELPGGVTATSTTASLQDSTSDPARFYRVVALSRVQPSSSSN